MKSLSFLATSMSFKTTFERVVGYPYLHQSFILAWTKARTLLFLPCKCICKTLIYPMDGEPLSPVKTTAQRFLETYLNFYIVVEFLAGSGKGFSCAKFKIPQLILHSGTGKTKRVPL